MSGLKAIIRHEIDMTLRQASTWLTPILFFLMVVSFFPFALGGNIALLKKTAPSIIWIAALLAILMSIDDLFRHDAENGALDLLLLSPYPLSILVLCKIISHWITHCLPLILMTPILGLWLYLNLSEQYYLLLSLLLGTPILCLLGSIGAALTIGIRGHGLLLPILIMPLYIPVLIFGTGVFTAIQTHASITSYFAILGAILSISLAFAPLLSSAALRIGVNQ